MSPATLAVSYTSVSLMQMVNADLGSISTLTSAQQANYAGEAQALVNAKIARFYSLPITVEVPLLQTVTTDIAIYLTVARRPYYKERLDLWLERYKEAFTYLDLISTGALQLVDSSGAVLGTRTDIAEAWSSTKDYHPIHWEGDWTVHVPDQDKVDAESDKRDIGPFPDRYLK